MTIEDLTREKSRLQQDIMLLVAAFENRTGAAVVEMRTVAQTMADGREKIIAVQVICDVS